MLPENPLAGDVLNHPLREIIAIISICGGVAAVAMYWLHKIKLHPARRAENFEIPLEPISNP